MARHQHVTVGKKRMAGPERWHGGGSQGDKLDCTVRLPLVCFGQCHLSMTTRTCKTASQQACDHFGKVTLRNRYNCSVYKTTEDSKMTSRGDARKSREAAARVQLPHRTTSARKRGWARISFFCFVLFLFPTSSSFRGTLLEHMFLFFFCGSLVTCSGVSNRMGEE